MLICHYIFYSNCSNVQPFALLLSCVWPGFLLLWLHVALVSAYIGCEQLCVLPLHLYDYAVLDFFSAIPLSSGYDYNSVHFAQVCIVCAVANFIFKE